MMEKIWISLIGAGLVFLGLFVLWLLMDLLVRATSKKKTNNIKEAEDNASSIKKDNDLQLKQKAAAASIAVSIALLNTSFVSTRFLNDQGMSSWQIAHRNQEIHNRSKLPFRNRYRK